MRCSMYTKLYPEWAITRWPELFPRSVSEKTNKLNSHQYQQ